ncbi:MAG: hypothetical protein R3D63_10860 [Paracoccaceae bacterium]
MPFENIEKSELVIATILRILNDRGIRGGTLQFGELDLSDEYFPFFATCFGWLQSEGIVRAEKVTVISADGDDEANDLYIYNPALTAHGFSLMGQSVRVGGANTTLRDAVETHLSSRPSGWQIGDLVGAIIGGFTKSIGS